MALSHPCAAVSHVAFKVSEARAGGSSREAHEGTTADSTLISSDLLWWWNVVAYSRRFRCWVLLDLNARIATDGRFADVHTMRVVLGELRRQFCRRVAPTGGRLLDGECSNNPPMLSSRTRTHPARMRSHALPFRFLLQVKNVSGRFLVGLRWWHEVNEDGSSQWKFESLDEEVRHHNRISTSWP